MHGSHGQSDRRERRAESRGLRGPGPRLLCSISVLQIYLKYTFILYLEFTPNIFEIYFYSILNEQLGVIIVNFGSKVEGIGEKREMRKK